jgi:hypothetical protein
MTAARALLLFFLVTMALPVSAQPVAPDAPGTTADAGTSSKRHRFSLGLGGGPLWTNKDAFDGVTWGPVARWRGRDDDGGWGASFEYSSFRSTVDADLGGRRQPFARATVRAMMGGVEYEIRRGQWSYEFGGVAGWSFNDIDPVDDAAAGAAGEVLDVDVSGSFAFGPTFTLWYDIPATRFAITATADYSVTRPEVSYRIAGVTFTQREWLAGLSLRVGFAVGLF